MTQRAINQYDVLKVVALLAMTLDHYLFFFGEGLEWLRIFGRIAAPLFLVLVGYNGSFRFRWSLFAAAMVVTLADGLLAGIWLPQNILWTILLTRIVLAYAVPRWPHYGLVIASVLLILPSMAVLDFGSFAVLFALVGYQLRQQQRDAAMVTLGITLLLFYVVAYYHLVPDLDAWQAALMGVLLAGMGAVLLRMDYLAPAPFLVRPIGFIATHALLYYVVHKTLLELFATPL